MRIDKIVVTGLFGRFDHELTFRPDERITIIHGPNGFGKTMILRILNALFNQAPMTLARMPFQAISVDFDDHSSLKVVRSRNEESSVPAKQQVEIQFRTNPAEQGESYVPAGIDPKELPFPVGAIEEMIPLLDQIGPDKWRHRRTHETLGLEDVLEQFADDLPLDESVSLPSMPDWLKAVREAMPVRFIDTERLTRPLPTQFPSRHYWTSPYERPYRMRRTVTQYSEELGELVQKTLSDYGSLAQSLDRTFPVRLVEEPPRPDYTMESLRSELSDVEAKRAQLVEAGLLAQEFEGEVPSLEKVDDSRRWPAPISRSSFYVSPNGF